MAQWHIGWGILVLLGLATLEMLAYGAWHLVKRTLPQKTSLNLIRLRGRRKRAPAASWKNTTS